ncbi:MAG: TolC family protein [Acidobacteriia bacterium]|nr:TolC family protein [Terriglobia bacterium]
MRTFDVSPCRGNRYKWFSVLTIITISLVLTSAPPWGAFAQEQQQTQQQTQKPQQAAQIEQTAQQALLDQIKLAPVSLVSPIEKAEKDGTALHLSMKDVTKLALQNNLNIAIQNTQEDLKQLAIVAARSYLDPSIQIRSSVGKDYQAPTQATLQATEGFITISNSASWNASINQPIPTGGSFSLGWNTSRRDDNVADNLTNPTYSTGASLSFTQPLWRNLKIDQNRNNIKIANMDLKLNDAQFKQQVTQTIASIQKAYWQLVSAIYSYNLSVSSVKLARESADMAKKKVEIGVSAPIEYTQSLASQASREVNVIRSEESILSQENNLRNLISPDRNNEIWGQVIVPTDTPEMVEYKVDLDQAIATAIKNSLQLQQDDINLQKSDLSYALTKEGKKWNIGLTAAIGSSGKGAVQGYREDRNGVLQPVLPEGFVGGLFTSYKTIFTGGTYNWSFQFNVTVPLRNRNVESSLATSRINRQNSVMTRTQHEQQVIVDIKNYVQALNTAKKQLETSAISRQLSESQLEAMNKRFAAGLATQYDVLTTQDQLANAQGNELTSKINYKSAVINLQQAMSTLLEESNIDVGNIGKTKPTTFK